MNKDCPLCRLIADSTRPKIYEDDDVCAFAQQVGAIPGQVMVVPKEHYPIIELVPDEILARVGRIANKLSVSIFDSLGFTGTNILAANGVSAGQRIAHFGLQVIPRRENDGLNFSWPTKKLSEEEMSTVEIKIKEQADHVGVVKQVAVENVKLDDSQGELLGGDYEEENYAIKQLDRIP